MFRKLFETGFNKRSFDLSVLVLRILVTAGMLTHGIPKVGKLLEGGEIQFGDPIGLGPGVSLALAAFAEVICAGLVGLGLGTRLAAVPVAFTMVVAAFIANAGSPFRNREMALLYLVFYLFFMVAGSGRYSFDHLISRKR